MPNPDTLIKLLTTQLHSQFVGGGLVLMFTGSIIAMMRKLPRDAIQWIKSSFTRVVTIDNTDPLFDYVTYWLDGQQKFSKSKHLRATTSLNLKKNTTTSSSLFSESGSTSGNSPTGTSYDYSPKKNPLQVFFSPSAGRHFMRYQGTAISIRLSSGTLPDSAKGEIGLNSGSGFGAKKESYIIEAYGSKENTPLKKLIYEIVEYGTEDTEGIRLYHSIYGGWESHGYIKMRPLETVILPIGIIESALQDMNEFRSSELWYRNLGIPWHRGYLWHGIPGSGKTSLAAALAGKLNIDVYLLSLSGTGMTDEKLESLMSRVRPGCMVILEDVDCTVPLRESAKNDGRGITLSGLLNCLDGITSREGCIIVMTTNRRDTLDTALVRPGRIDMEIEFGFANADQITRLAGRIGVGCAGIHPDSLTMAEVQKELLGRQKKSRVMSAGVSN